MPLMFKDGFDKLHGLALLLAIAGVAALLLISSGSGDASARADLDRQLAQDVAYRARVDFLQDLYRPVVELEQGGAHQQALLTLGEISRRYPGEGYGSLLKGRILLQVGAIEEAIASYVQGVKLNGDFADKQGPFSAWSELNGLVENQLAPFKQRARANPDNASPKQVLNNLHYLQSRLAGGCE